MKKRPLPNTLGTGKKKKINSFLGLSTPCNERKKKGIRIGKDTKVSHRYSDYIHRKIWGTLQIIKTESSIRLLNTKSNTQINNLRKNVNFLKILVTF